MSENQFVKFPAELLNSGVLPLLRINTWRLLCFLMREHVHHGGKENGLLLAPREQLEEYGIGPHFISNAIDQAEQLGLVDCQRGTGKRPSYYALTWLKLHDGSPGSNRWRDVATAKQQSPASVATAVSTSSNCQTAVSKPVATAKQQSLRPESRGAKQQYLSRRSCQDGRVLSVGEGKTVTRVMQAPGMRLKPEIRE